MIFPTVTKLSSPITQSVRYSSSIRVVLLSDLPKKGGKGEVVKVARGFARNFLIPNKIAGKFQSLTSYLIVSLYSISSLFTYRLLYT